MHYPLGSISGPFMDLALWKFGAASWKSQPARTKSKRALELDFLRGWHRIHTLLMFQGWLHSVTGYNVRVSSMWQDKHAWATLDTTGALKPPKQELADLGVVIRYGNARTWMWLIQAKREDAPDVPLTGPSTVKEINLFENLPHFSLLADGSKISSPFDLTSDFGGQSASYRHWSFLIFDKELARSELSICDTPVSDRWKGSAILPAQLNSFSETLALTVDTVATGNMANAFRGAEVGGSGNSEWTRLYETLFKTPYFEKPSGHAASASNPDGTTILGFQPSVGPTRLFGPQLRTAGALRTAGTCSILSSGFGLGDLRGADRFDPTRLSFDLGERSSGGDGNGEDRTWGGDDGNGGSPSLTLIIDIPEQ